MTSVHGSVAGRASEDCVSSSWPVSLLRNFWVAPSVDTSVRGGTLPRSEDVGSYGRASADHGLASQNGGVRINRDAVLNVRMPFGSLHDTAFGILREAPCSQGDTVVELQHDSRSGRFPR